MVNVPPCPACCGQGASAHVALPSLVPPLQVVGSGPPPVGGLGVAPGTVGVVGGAVGDGGGVGDGTGGPELGTGWAVGTAPRGHGGVVAGGKAGAPAIMVASPDT